MGGQQAGTFDETRRVLEDIGNLPALGQEGNKKCKVGECREPNTADLMSC